MSRYLSDGTQEPTNLFECAAWHYSIKAICETCQRSSVFDPHQLWWLFQQKRWDDRLDAARLKFRCKSCRNRTGKARLVLVSDRPTVQMEYPPEREWKAALRRYRS